VSVTFVDHVKTNKHVEIFSPSGSNTILVFRTKRGGDILTETPYGGGVSNAGGVGRNYDSEPISGLMRAVNAAAQPAYR